MINKTKIALAAAVVLASASAALADDNPYTWEKNQYLRNPNAPVPTYNEQAVQYQAAPRGQLFEGRNVGVPAAAPSQQIPSELKRSFDRNAIDFNS
jgi:hypothetical protein